MFVELSLRLKLNDKLIVIPGNVLKRKKRKEEIKKEERKKKEKKRKKGRFVMYIKTVDRFDFLGLS